MTWERTRKEEQQEIIDGINAYLNYINVERVEERFIKQGSTWFNQNCWKDEYEENAGMSTQGFDYDNLQEIAFRKSLESWK